jgi:hypothetical protein
MHQCHWQRHLASTPAAPTPVCPVLGELLLWLPVSKKQQLPHLGVLGASLGVLGCC